MNSNAQLKLIAELDLDPIKVKLMHKESGEGWSRAQADAVEFEYRRFLTLMTLFPEESVAPLFDVDIFWHYHILDTMKYADDCANIFGYFLHHFPYAGLRGEDDEAAHQAVGARMQELYEATFGESYVRRQETAAADAATAFSIPTSPERANIAFSIPTSPAKASIAFSIPTSPSQAKVAFSIPTSPAKAKIAFSIPTSPEAAKIAFSIPTSPAAAKIAFSIPTSPSVAKIAFSIPTSPAAADPDQAAALRSQASRFHSERPTLAAA